MKVFISWSGEKSRAVAELLDAWLKCVLQALQPWVSTKDIDKGSIWFSEISDQLRETSMGIICLTKENKDRPWILFEVGALTKGLSSNRVCPLLIDLQSSDIEAPLSQYNHTMPDKESIRHLVRTLNTYLGDKALGEKVLEKVFETYWPQFEAQFNEILLSIPEMAPTVKRTKDDILSEVLDTVRGLDKRVRNIESSQIVSAKDPNFYYRSGLLGLSDLNQQEFNKRYYFSHTDEDNAAESKSNNTIARMKHNASPIARKLIENGVSEEEAITALVALGLPKQQAINLYTSSRNKLNHDKTGS